MFAIETTSRVKFIFMNRKATKILLLANFSLHDTCHRTEIFKRPVFLPFGRTFFEKRNTNKNITFLTEPLKSLQVFPQGRSFLRAGLSSRNKNFMLCFPFDKITWHVLHSTIFEELHRHTFQKVLFLSRPLLLVNRIEVQCLFYLPTISIT